MKQSVALAIACILLLAQADARQRTSSPTHLPSASLALVTTYADGTAHHDLVSAKRGSWWTFRFPRIESWTPPSGTLRVAKLKVARQLVGPDVRVVVSVLRGSPDEQEEIVAVVTLSPGAHVVIDQLRAYGVRPVSFTVVEAEPMVPFLPSVLSIEPELEIAAIELLTAPYPGYRITVRNASSIAVANFHVQSYRGAAPAISFLRRGEGGRPTVLPDGSYSFELPLTGGTNDRVGAGPWSPLPLDVIEIDSVLWADGTFVGNPRNAWSQRNVPGLEGRRFLLKQALDTLRAAERLESAADELLAAVRAGFEALPTADGTRLPDAEARIRETRLAVLADLHRFESGRPASANPDEVRRWIRHTIDRYERWMARVSP